MEGLTIDAILNYGIFAGLFCSLLWYVLKNSDMREKRLLNVIEKLDDAILKEVKDIKEIVKNENK